MTSLPPIEATQPCYKCHRTGPLVVDRFAQEPNRWDDPERFMHQYGLCQQPPSASMPRAADLPRDSLVTHSTGVFIKTDMTGVDNWAMTGWITPFGDADIDELLQSGEATVLRVGNGTS